MFPVMGILKNKCYGPSDPPAGPQGHSHGGLQPFISAEGLRYKVYCHTTFTMSREMR